MVLTLREGVLAVPEARSFPRRIAAQHRSAQVPHRLSTGHALFARMKWRIETVRATTGRAPPFTFRGARFGKNHRSGGGTSMLILTRRPGESVKIGDDITVTVLAIKGNQLRLGFTAPQNIAVHREEVYQRIQAEKITNISQARGRRSVEVSTQTRNELLKW